EQEVDADSLLEDAKFLSFEEWKKQNLERAGQSPEHVGNGRGGAAGGTPGRKRPDISNLDSLGDEGEIDFDFGAFAGIGKEAPPNSESPTRSESSTEEQSSEAAPAVGYLRSKDAGKTCKERYNYASFDCAATVLKTNPQCKSATSVLLENKDSYMLNECAAANKFLVVELCDDIIVDTIVLANFEFFSSMVRTFRVSVSDRYPPKPNQWVDLGVYEARNSREIQAFLVDGPRVWARYLRLEFLTHYGNEYYCPVSLLRVHGITMMEEYKHEEERATSDVPGTLSAEPGKPMDPAKPIDVSGVSSDFTSMPPSQRDSSGEVSSSGSGHQGVNEAGVTASERSTDASANSTKTTQGTSDRSHRPINGTDTNTTGSTSVKGSTSTTSTAAASVDTQHTHKSHVSGDTTGAANSTNRGSSGETVGSGTTIASSKLSQNGASHDTIKSSGSTAPPQPPAASPPTQESFFKSVDKRLRMLESNATLSLQYIEEQSRILRDAFTKVEKRQLSKTETFLNHLNTTVMAELKTFRTQYDQLWQSTVIELETHREQYQRELLAISTRLTLLADEVIFQKRMAVVQSTLLLMCLGFVLFVKHGNSSLEMPIVQNMMNKSQRFKMSLAYDSPPGSPDRPSSPDSGRRGSRINLRKFFRESAFGGGDSPVEKRRPIVEISPPTPADESPVPVRSFTRDDS
ncbi:hypothetical protein NA57DRAFT_7324, partial [Rhizodiscina lignyota]